MTRASGGCGGEAAGFSGDGWAVREALGSVPAGDLAAEELALLQIFREQERELADE